MSGTTAFWYASRATGIVALLLLTAVLVLGILVNRQGRLPGLPRFAVTSLHRNISLRPRPAGEPWARWSTWW